MPRKSANSKRQSALKRWKTFNEKEILESYFNLDNNWGRKTINYVKALVSLSEEQIYKWGYERKRKVKIAAKKSGNQPSAHLSGNNWYFLDQVLDYNAIVSELFPDGEWNSDKLSKEERKRYDQLKNQMMKKDASIRKMSELDQILLERLSANDMGSKKTKSERKSSLEEHSTLMEGLVKEEEARKSVEDPSLFKAQFEDSKISQKDEKYQFPKFETRGFEFCPIEENINFGDLPNELFQDSLFLDDECQKGEFQI